MKDWKQYIKNLKNGYDKLEVLEYAAVIVPALPLSELVAWPKAEI